jgi:hypothetical protein
VADATIPKCRADLGIRFHTRIFWAAHDHVPHCVGCVLGVVLRRRRPLSLRSPSAH